MPRTLLACALVVVATGCVFDADYRGGHFTCSDNVCPTGQTCTAQHVCIAAGSGSDAGTHDAPPIDAAPDAPAHALTCSDPDPLPASGGTASGSTAGRGNHVTALCAGVVHNGADAVYAIDLPAAAQLRVSLTGSAALDAYVIAPCADEPATPSCVGNAVATTSDPLVVTAASAATYFVVVDSEQAAETGAYTVTLTRL